MKKGIIRITPENITDLKENEVFVFGSNLKGNHLGGAAKLALEKFGAINGKHEGLQGNSYALPTLSKDMSRLSIEEIEKSVASLLSIVIRDKNKTFLITDVGCGIAGFSNTEIAPLFKNFHSIENVTLPLSFLEVLGINGYKAFDSGMICRDKTYSENTLFEEDCKPVPCKKGMHFCEHPLDVLNYYNHKPGNDYAKVVAVGDFEKEGDKITTNKLLIKSKIKFTDLIKAHFEIIKETVTKSVSITKNRANTSGYKSHANTSGEESHANTSGNYSHANTSGEESHANTSGNYSHANTSGNYSHANTSGEESHANTSGYKSHANTSGYKSHANTSGEESISCSLGVFSKSKAYKGWIIIVDWRQNEDYDWYIKEIYRAKVGKHKIKGVLIKPGVSYWIENGKLMSE